MCDSSQLRLADSLRRCAKRIQDLLDTRSTGSDLYGMTRPIAVQAAGIVVQAADTYHDFQPSLSVTLAVLRSEMPSNPKEASIANDVEEKALRDSVIGELSPRRWAEVLRGEMPSNPNLSVNDAENKATLDAIAIAKLSKLRWEAIDAEGPENLEKAILDGVIGKLSLPGMHLEKNKQHPHARPKFSGDQLFWLWRVEIVRWAFPFTSDRPEAAGVPVALEGQPGYSRDELFFNGDPSLPFPMQVGPPSPESPQYYDDPERFAQLKVEISHWPEACDLLAERLDPAGGRAKKPSLDPEPAAQSASGSVKLFGRGDSPIVKNVPQKRLTGAQYDVVLALLEAGDLGLTKDTLDSKSKHGDARKILSRLAEKSPEWGSVISLPGTPGMGYRIL